MNFGKTASLVAVAAMCVTGCSREAPFKHESLLGLQLDQKVGSDLAALQINAVECGTPGLVSDTLRISCPPEIHVRANRFKGTMLWDFAVEDEKSIGPGAIVDQVAAEISAVAKPLLQEQQRQAGNQQAWGNLRATEEQLRQPQPEQPAK